jgi:RNA polymerase sigma-70 factor (ECF subfamily)
MKLVDRLKEEQRAVFLLKYAHDMSHRDIAKTLGITENNVTVRLHRAKAKLLSWAKEVQG